MSRYLDDLIVPVSIILGALLIGIVLERLVGRGLYRALKRRNWRIARRLVRSFNGIFTIWLGIAAFRAVLDDLPLKASAVPVIQKVISAILILTFAVLLARVFIAFIRSFSSSRGERAVASISLIENIVRGIVWVFGLLAVFRTFGVAVTPMLTALGVGGLAVALALQDTLSNFFAGLYIILSRSMSAGDYIRLASGEEGVINDIAWRVTTLRTRQNTLVIVPNNKFSTSIVTNYDRPTKSMSLVIPFTLDANTDLAAFERRALEAARHAIAKIPEATVGEPVFEYTSMGQANVTVQLVLETSDFVHQQMIQSAILRELALRKDTQ